MSWFWLVMALVFFSLDHVFLGFICLAVFGASD